MMKFDVVIGNPPYQEESLGTSDDSIYHFFMDESYQLADKTILITPARFLFNAGKTPKPWNHKMLNDDHLKVEYYEQDSTKVFPTTDIKGGIAITYRDINKKFGKIGIFTSYPELNSIAHKVGSFGGKTLDSIISGQGIYRFTQTMHSEHPKVIKILSKSHPNDVGSGVLNTLHNVIFFEKQPNDGNKYYEVLGLYRNKRVYHYIREDYLNKPAGYDKFRVVLPKANGSGSIGEVLSTPLIATPLMGFTQTFISIGSFDLQNEAENCLKYVKTKFARTMLGILKITQDNPRSKWEKVPMQDFTSNSDIDWTKSIPEIDQQLYKKYSLNEEEINFIETKGKEMD